MQILDQSAITGTHTCVLKNVPRINLKNVLRIDPRNDLENVPRIDPGKLVLSIGDPSTQKLRSTTSSHTGDTHNVRNTIWGLLICTEVQ